MATSFELVLAIRINMPTIVVFLDQAISLFTLRLEFETEWIY